ncbi:MAG: DNA polymerase III subunit alpha [Firmicutes bacterium]|nr:DNA polymerase III subunit alpha [Bacillota bacterium]
MTGVAAGPLLGLRSPYVPGRALLDLDQALEAAAARGWRLVALADDPALPAGVAFWRAARARGLVPYLAVERLLLGAGGARPVHLWAGGEAGWRVLCRLALEPDPLPWDRVRPWLGRALWVSGEPGALPPGPGVRAEFEPGQAVPEGPALAVWWAAFRDPADLEAYRVLAALHSRRPDPRARPVVARAALAAACRGCREEMPFDPPELPDSRPKLPRFLPGAEVAAELALLEGRVRTGARRRWGPGWPQREGLRSRLEQELEVIGALGFAGYFLIVEDLVNEARRLGIRVGPGRGSAAGSAVAYALGITAIDPLRYGLRFERFLNRDRKGLPDIDLDFADARRLELVEYLRRRWTPERTAQIGTWGTFGPRAVLRDLGRWGGVPAPLVEAAVRTLPAVGGRLADGGADLERALARWPTARPWLDLARRLEGLPRHASVHAAGVVITPGPLWDFLPVRQAEGGFVTAPDRAGVEALGLLKLDLLGLRTLSVLDAVEEGVRAAGAEPPALGAAPPDDPETLALLGAGDTEGVFQLDSAGVRDLLRRMRPRHLEEVMAVVALYRPGPMTMIPEYLERRRSGVPPGDPLAGVCRDTYGVLVYQEQLMQLAQELAGFSPGEADALRRAVSKKDHALLEELGGRLRAALAAAGLGEAEVAALWARIAAFGDYGFNKAHAAGYGLLAYHLAYLKAHHPLEFWSAQLAGIRDSDRLAAALRACVQSGITVLRPRLDRPQPGRPFRPAGPAALQAGLAVIRGLGEAHARLVAEELDRNGPFVSRAEAARRLLPRLGARAWAALEAAGALPAEGEVPAAGTAGGQLSLFGEAPGPAAPAPAGPDDGTAFGFPWPEPAGVWVVKLAGSGTAAALEGLAAVARAWPGGWSWVQVVGRGRGRRLPLPGAAGDPRVRQAALGVAGVEGCVAQIRPNGPVPPVS